MPLLAMYSRRHKRVSSMQMSDANSGPGEQNATTGSSGSKLDLAGRTEAEALPSWIEERARVAVNRNVRIAGHLVFQEPIRIDGHFRGEVSSSDLVVISEEGSVGGRIRSPRLVVLGELQGEIRSKSVILGPHSHFKGKIEADNLTICEGAHLNADLRIGCRSEIRQH
jgi:cytoskeletal protein CcmA (bactofilin family)